MICFDIALVAVFLSRIRCVGTRGAETPQVAKLSDAERVFVFRRFPSPPREKYTLRICLSSRTILKVWSTNVHRVTCEGYSHTGPGSV